MNFLNSLKLPAMVLMTVGAVWAAAWNASDTEDRRRTVLPATASVERLVAKVRAENPQPSEARHDGAEVMSEPTRALR